MTDQSPEAPPSSAPVTQDTPPASDGRPAETQPQTQERTTPPANDAAQQQIERLTRQINGDKPFVETWRKYGINSAEQLDQALQSHQRVNQLREQGFDINTIKFDQPQQAQAQQPDDMKSLVNESVREALGGFERERAEHEHEAGNTAAYAKLQSFAKDIAGDNQSLFLPLVNQAATEFYKSNGRRYPDYHPLHDTQYQPLTDAEIEQVKEIALRKFDTLRGMDSSTAAARGSIEGSTTPAQSGTTDGGQVRVFGPRADKAKRSDMVRAAFNRELGRSSGETMSNS